METIITGLRDAATALAALGTYHNPSVREIERVIMRLETSQSIATGIKPPEEEPEEA